MTLTMSRTSGFSEQAQMVDGQLMSIYTALNNFREATFQDLSEISEEAKIENWAGYESKAITKNEIENAARVIQSLPFDIQNPELGIEPDGQITFEWYKDSNHVLSMSVDENRLHYACINGLSKSHGEEPFFGQFPERIAFLIRLL